MGRRERDFGEELTVFVTDLPRLGKRVLALQKVNTYVRVSRPWLQLTSDVVPARDCIQVLSCAAKR